MSNRELTRAYRLPESVIRNFYYQTAVSSAVFKFDALSLNCIALDYEVYNRGAADVTIAIDSMDAITCPAGGTRGMNNIRFSLISISSGTFDVCIAGVLLR